MEENLQIWEKIFQEREWGKYPALPVVRFIARNFYKAPHRKDVKILEVGSGIGANLWYCAKEGFSVIALEGSKTAIDIMHKRFESDGLKENVFFSEAGDYFNTLDSVEDGTIDAAIDVESLVYNDFERTRDIIKKIIKKLKSGGKFISMAFADGTWGMDCEEYGYHLVRPVEGPMANEGVNRYTTKEDIPNLYKLDNNKIEKIERQDYYFENGKVLKEWVIEIAKI